MKISVLLICILLSSKLCAQKTNYQINAVAFYNLENLFDTINDVNKNDEEFLPDGGYHYTSIVYKEKLHNLATVIQKLGTEYVPQGVAFLGVSEVENNSVLVDLVNEPELKNRNYQSICFYGPDARGVNAGFIYNPGYFKMISAKTFRVDLSSIENHATRDVLLVAGIMSGDTVFVLVNHWPSRSGGEAASAPKRAIAADVNRKVIDSLLKENAGSKIFVMGDLNDDPTNISVAKHLGSTGDKEAVSAKKMYNPWTNYYKKGIGTLGYDDSWNLFDQIIISKDIVNNSTSWRYYKSEVFNKDFLIEKYGQYKGYPKRAFVNGNWNNGYSDHFPVVMYLVKPAKENN